MPKFLFLLFSIFILTACGDDSSKSSKNSRSDDERAEEEEEEVEEEQIDNGPRQEFNLFASYTCYRNNAEFCSETYNDNKIKVKAAMLELNEDCTNLKNNKFIALSLADAECDESLCT